MYFGFVVTKFLFFPPILGSDLFLFCFSLWFRLSFRNTGKRLQRSDITGRVSPQPLLLSPTKGRFRRLNRITNGEWQCVHYLVMNRAGSTGKKPRKQARKTAKKQDDDAAALSTRAG
jgi:hypothetical protein